jgi:hypothetical protein
MYRKQAKQSSPDTKGSAKEARFSADEAKQIARVADRDRRLKREERFQGMSVKAAWEAFGWPKVKEQAKLGSDMTWIRYVPRSLAEQLVDHAKMLGYKAKIDADGDVQLSW